MLQFQNVQNGKIKNQKAQALSEALLALLLFGACEGNGY